MKRMKNVVIHYITFTFVLLLFLAGCTTSSPAISSNHITSTQQQSSNTTSSINTPIATTGCGHASSVALGTSTSVTIPVNPATSEGSHTRTYILHVPSTYNQQHPYAVVLSFHGYSGHATDMDHGSGFSQLAEQQGFLAVYPQGLPDGKNRVPFWAEVGPIDYGIDEAAFVSTLLDSLQAHFCVDARRVYATGFSNGGGMTAFLACRFAGRIAAFAPISGNFYAIPGGCHPVRPVPILDFHGTKDRTLPYAGIPVSKNAAWPLPPVPQTLQEWALRDGCTQGPTIFLHQTNVTGEQWNGCKGGATVIHYRIEGGGHTEPPPIQGHSSAEVIWTFFHAHPLP